MYEIEYHKDAIKEIPKLKEAKLAKKVQQLIELIKANPFQNPPPYENLVGKFNGLYSRRINIQHRLIYQVIEKKVRILSMWSHYE